ncbi:MAG: Fic family protein [Terrimicrobiaceae bacterium]
MNIQEYHAGIYEPQFEYKSFLPSPINLEWEISDPATVTLLAESTRLLGELNAFAQLIPDVDFFIKMHLAKEATTSSRIEGTQTNMEEALYREEDLKPEQRDDWNEVQNYIAAANHSIARLAELPLSSRLLKEAHATLLRGVRGKHKQPGEFRSSQNWIGVNLKNATFIPPHHDRLGELMSDLENFLHNDQIHVPHLIKIALVHYQFETIHPFLDGNGRLGRLLIVLYLVNTGLLLKPALYLSDFFERNKPAYYDELTAVRATSRLSPWLRFFLLGVSETAAASIQVFKDILQLKDEIDHRHLTTLSARRQIKARALMRQLYQAPVITIREATGVLGTQTNTAAALIADFVAMGILREITGQQRHRLFVFDAYLKIFNR